MSELDGFLYLVEYCLILFSIFQKSSSELRCDVSYHLARLEASRINNTSGGVALAINLSCTGTSGGTFAQGGLWRNFSSSVGFDPLGKSLLAGIKC